MLCSAQSARKLHHSETKLIKLQAKVLFIFVRGVGLNKLEGTGKVELLSQSSKHPHQAKNVRPKVKLPTYEDPRRKGGRILKAGSLISATAVPIRWGLNYRMVP